MSLLNKLSKEDKTFIRENYLTMHDSKIAKELKISTYYLQQFRIHNKLMKKNPNRPRVIKMEGEFFNVNEMENWVI